MNILHLLSQNHLTGAEVYAATLARQQGLLGQRVWQVSNGFFHPTEATKIELAVETKSRWVFFQSVLQLRKILKTEKIDVIHTHSRAAVKLARWATVGLPVATVSTVHGRQHFSFSKKFFNHYGQFIITVCENLKTHLIKDFNYRPNNIRVLRNPIDFKKFFFTNNNINKNNLQDSTNRHLRCGIIGRTTGPKAQRTEQIVHELIRLSELLKFKIDITLVGGQKEHLALNESEKKHLTEITIKDLSAKDYHLFDFTVGSGRVSMESLLSGIPTLAFGEALHIGLIRRGNIDRALESNFGDIDEKGQTTPTLNRQQLAKDIEMLLQNEISEEERQDLSFLAQKHFDTEVITQKIQRLYESARLLRHHPQWIPVLMYHKIPDTEIQSQHKIYVVKSDFEKHLQFYKSRGFQTLDFYDLEMFRKGQWPLEKFPKKPLILTFDDGYKDNLTNAAPLLEKYDFKAQLFLLAEKSIRANSWDVSSTEPEHEIVSGEDRQKWLTTRFQIGSHGFSHRKITEFNSDEALQELKESKNVLENEFKKNINCYAFTYGTTTPQSPEWAEKAGYSYAVNTDNGGLHLEEEPYSIFRVNIFPNETKWTLWKKTASWYRSYYFRKRGH